MFFKPIYILILFFTIVIDYFVGIHLEKTQDLKKKKALLVYSFIANLSVLAIFKYFNFINENIRSLSAFFGIYIPISYLDILMPIGLSFHTFQAMSYTIEVYRGNQKAERHFGIYALYVMFYPQLVAGPIERPRNLIHQFYEKKYFSYDNALLGLNLIVFGLFKKIVVADRLAVYVNEVYADLGNANTISVVFACVFFSIQIYCDFSGYTDIARGCAKFMGFELMLNFNRPYRATSISDFWSRWHISLSTWFRDYLYIPLGGNRNGTINWYRNLIIVFLLSGLWHGANWTFIIWGGLHAFFIIFGIATVRFRENIGNSILRNRFKLGRNLLNQFITFILVTLAWIFFRATSINQAFEVLKIIGKRDFSLNPQTLSAGTGVFNLIFSFFILGLFCLTYFLPKILNFKNNTVFIIATTLLIIILGKNGTNEFIYFRF